MTDDQLLRYSRHILLDELGIEGQERILAAHALVIGAGGLGSPVALYLASAGVGHITLVDHDTVDTTNLQRRLRQAQRPQPPQPRPLALRAPLPVPRRVLGAHGLPFSRPWRVFRVWALQQLSPRAC